MAVIPGISTLKSAYLGSTLLSKVMVGTEQIWPTGPWTPADLGTALLTWLDATDPATITDVGGGAVSVWTDKSVHARPYNQGTAVRRPKTGTRTINGKNVLDFDGVDDWVQHTFATAYSQPLTLAGVLASDTVTAGGRLFGQTNTFLINHSNDGRYAYQAGAARYGGTYAIGVPDLVVACFDGVLSCLRVNKVEVHNGAVSSPGTNGILSGTAGIVGVQNATTAQHDGVVGEVLLVQGNLKGTETLTKLEDYLWNKWALGSAPPTQYPSNTLYPSETLYPRS